MSTKGYCLKPLYETMTTYPLDGNTVSYDRWLTKNNYTAILYRTTQLYLSSIHPSLDAARGTWWGYIPARILLTHTGSTACYVGRVEEE